MSLLFPSGSVEWILVSATIFSFWMCHIVNFISCMFAIFECTLLHRATLSARDSCCSLWLLVLGLIFLFSSIVWVIHTAPRFVCLQLIDGLPISYLQVFMSWAVSYGLYSYYCGSSNIWSIMSPPLFIHSVHTWLFLRCILGRAISEYVLTFLSVSSKMLLGPNLLALQEGSFVSRHAVCPPKSS